MGISEKKLLMNANNINTAIEQIANTILTDFPYSEIARVGFIGIQIKGVPLAKRIISMIESKTGHKSPLGMIDISMYRDDIGTHRKIEKLNETLIPFDIEDKVVILTDDVIHTGRTIRAALDAITDFGRPKLIKLAVLIDRGGREYPIRPDYTAHEIKMSNNSKIFVEWTEESGKEDSAYLLEG